MAAVSCDARTRHISERDVYRAISEIRITLLDILANRETRIAVENVRNTLDILELAARNGPIITSCDWTGEVEDPDLWKCPECLTWHNRLVPRRQGRMNR